jgi:hypothetical protein
MQEWLDSLDAKLITAGFAGALIALGIRPTKSVYGAFVTVFSGIACANYLPPLINQAWSLPLNIYGSVAFLCGLTAMPMSGWVLRNISRFLDKKFKDS